MYSILKRGLDVLGAGFGLLLFLPVGLVIALVIKVSDGGPVFYGQVRVGRNGQLFKIWKFRSMVPNADRVGVAITQGADPRITRIGRWLRGTKMDELPQLWNVFVGEMSLVGPRPEVPKYVALYSPSQREVLRFRPGITDVASLSFRDEEGLLAGAPDVEEFYIRHCLPKKIDLNLEYQRAASVLGDLGVIARTVGLMFSRISDGGSVGRDDLSRDDVVASGTDQRVAIIGAGIVGQEALKALQKCPGFRVIGFFDDDPRSWHQRHQGVEVMGMPECLGNAAWKERVDAVVLALGPEREARANQLRAWLEDFGLKEVPLREMGARFAFR
jgi:lipopolysaccharide/colanic/teichoic acid biosynthesis glycosyltransferase